MKKVSLVLISLLIFAGSCGEKYLEVTPLTEITVENFYKTEQDALGAILAAYSVLQGPRFYGRAYYWMLEMASDDVTTKLQQDTYDNFVWSAVQNNQYFNDLWAQVYEGIFRANLVLDNVPGIVFKDKINKQHILAEAYFLRGLYFWHSAVLFGDGVILKSAPKTVDESIKERSKRSEVFLQAIEDLKIAAGKKPEILPGLPEEWDTKNLGRATKYAALAMLGKVYLYNRNYTEAIAAFTEVVNSGKYRLLDDFASIFKPNNEFNQETIFEISYTDRGQGTNGYFSDGGVAGEGSQRDLMFGIQNQEGQLGFGELIATDDFYNEFEAGDARLNKTLIFIGDTLTGYGEGVQSSTKTIIYKLGWATKIKEAGNNLYEVYHVKKGVEGYTGAGGPVQSPNNFRMIRYADVLLMLAEAKYEANNGDATAITHLNEVRRRARKLGIGYDRERKYYTGDRELILADYPYSSLKWSGEEFAPDMRTAIVHERRVELAFEYHRFLDMRRWDEIPGHPGGAEGVFKSKDEKNFKNYNKNVHSLCPIPQPQIDLSKGKIQQNPGY